MAEQIVVGTRKGTFLVQKTGGTWRPRLAGHAGVCCNYVARDPNTGTLWAALGFGHWGAKLSRSDDNGKTWQLRTARRGWRVTGRCARSWGPSSNPST